EMPWAYSGLAIMSAFEAPTASLKRATLRGGSESRSALNGGREPRASHTAMCRPGGARRDAARQKAALMEDALRLPATARTVMPHQSTMKSLAPMRLDDRCGSAWSATW